MRLPIPNADGLALVQISGTADAAEALFESLVSSTSWEPVTTIQATPIPWEDDTHAQTWAVYLRPREDYGPSWPGDVS